MARNRIPLEVRFWRHVTPGSPEECWLWAGARFPTGYGAINEGGRGKILYAHRLMWTFTSGPIPDGYFVCHRCDTPPCCNPAHLFLGTHLENMADMVAKGRWLGTRADNPKFHRATILSRLRNDRLCRMGAP